MSFLDLVFAIFLVAFFVYIRPIGEDDRGFGRNTTATLRGLAMLGIILHHIHNRFGGHSPILSHMGYLTTGFFFYISGYGNMISVNKKSEVNFEWLCKKFLKIYIPFFVAYWLYYVMETFMYSDLKPNLKETILDIVTVSLPNQVSWFPKIILLCFLLHYLAKKILKKEILQNIFILSCIVIYMGLVWKIGYPDYWYNSVICYSVGCILAKPQIFSKLLNYLKEKKIFSFISFGILFLLVFLASRKIRIIKFACPIVFSLMCYYFSFIFTVKTRILAWVGNNSFEFYVFHIVALQTFCKLIETNKYIYTGLVILSSFLMVYIFLFVKNKAILKNNTFLSDER